MNRRLFTQVQTMYTNGLSSKDCIYLILKLQGDVDKHETAAFIDEFYNITVSIGQSQQKPAK